MSDTDGLIIRKLQAGDCSIISSAFAAQGWNKPAAQYERYMQETVAGEREVLIAEIEEFCAGYVTVVWSSDYVYFRESSIPEIVDFNVLKRYQGRRIGSRLLDAAESAAANRSGAVGVRVGLTPDYGPAQRLYVSRGFVPDGRGISQRGIFPVYGDRVVIDDDLAIAFTKLVQTVSG